MNPLPPPPLHSFLSPSPPLSLSLPSSLLLPPPSSSSLPFPSLPLPIPLLLPPGKWTTYRSMAKETMDKVVEVGKLEDVKG